MEWWGGKYQMDPWIISADRGNNKQMVLEHYGIPTPAFAIVNLEKHGNKALTPDVIRALTKTSKYAPRLLDPMSYPLFAKPLAEGSSKGIKQTNVIQNIDELCQAVEELRSSATSAPAILVEKFLAGREFTVGILGTGDDAWVLGVSEMVWEGDKAGVDVDVHFQFTENPKASEDWDALADEMPANREDPLVERACTAALRAWRALRCRDGGRVDIRFDSGSADAVANVLEVSDVLRSYICLGDILEYMCRMTLASLWVCP
jgi:D-alanine-D-alanine ligase-like ATP-grasp enzyme